MTKREKDPKSQHSIWGLGYLSAGRDEVFTFLGRRAVFPHVVFMIELAKGLKADTCQKKGGRGVTLFGSGDNLRWVEMRRNATVISAQGGNSRPRHVRLRQQKIKITQGSREGENSSSN